VASGDLGLETEEGKKAAEKETEQHKAMFEKMKEILSGKVKDVVVSKRLRTHPVCFTIEGGLSLEMEKVLKQMPNGENIKAEKILEINTNHDVFKALVNAFEKDDEKFKLYTNILYNQAMLIEGLPIEDPIQFSNDLS